MFFCPRLLVVVGESVSLWVAGGYVNFATWSYDWMPELTPTPVFPALFADRNLVTGTSTTPA